jgi:hypothetical protein
MLSWLSRGTIAFRIDACVAGTAMPRADGNSSIQSVPPTFCDGWVAPIEEIASDSVGASMKIRGGYEMSVLDSTDNLSGSGRSSQVFWSRRFFRKS